MAGLEIPLLIGGALGGLSMYSSAQANSAQNEYMSDTYAAQQAAMAAQNKQVRDQESLEKQKGVNQAQLIAARIRVTAGESGLGTGGTAEALLRQVDYDTYVNRQIATQNAANQFLANAGIIQPVASQQFNPLLDGLSAGIGGFATGLSITNNTQQPAGKTYQTATPTNWLTRGVE